MAALLEVVQTSRYNAASLVQMETIFTRDAVIFVIILSAAMLLLDAPLLKFAVVVIRSALQAFTIGVKFLTVFIL